MNALYSLHGNAHCLMRSYGLSLLRGNALCAHRMAVLLTLTAPEEASPMQKCGTRPAPTQLSTWLLLLPLLPLPSAPAAVPCGAIMA